MNELIKAARELMDAIHMEHGYIGGLPSKPMTELEDDLEDVLSSVEQNPAGYFYEDGKGAFILDEQNTHVPENAIPLYK
ncbi:MAG: hypothetical protein GQ474_08055 [Sulfurimonas sp.]|nr:hypothetical protein [Sulfurimonas sp.]